MCVLGWGVQELCAVAVDDSVFLSMEEEDEEVEAEVEAEEDAVRASFSEALTLDKREGRGVG